MRKFLDGLLHHEVKFEVEYHKEPRDIDEAVYHVVKFIQTRYSTRKERPRFSTRKAASYQNHSEPNLERADFEERAVKRVPAYDGHHRTPQKRSVKDPNQDQTSTTTSQEELLQQLLQRMEKLEKATASNVERKQVKEVECFFCHQKGHYAREWTM